MSTLIHAVTAAANGDTAAAAIATAGRQAVALAHDFGYISFHTADGQVTATHVASADQDTREQVTLQITPSGRAYLDSHQ